MDRLMDEIINSFESCRDAERGASMAAYMKNNFEFLGIPSPKRKEISKPFLKTNFADDKELIHVVNELWDLSPREYQYLGMEMLNRKKKLLDISHLPKIEEYIAKKSWWDTVDFLASNVVGYIMSKESDHKQDLIQPWIESENMWLNRTAILFQLKYKSEVDTDVLKKAILAHIESNEFFHQKAIGWALRQYSKFDPEWVSAFLGNNSLKPLSEREASKYL